MAIEIRARATSVGVVRSWSVELVSNLAATAEVSTRFCIKKQSKQVPNNDLVDYVDCRWQFLFFIFYFIHQERKFQIKQVKETFICKEKRKEWLMFKWGRTLETSSCLRLICQRKKQTSFKTFLKNKVNKIKLIKIQR